MQWILRCSSLSKLSKLSVRMTHHQNSSPNITTWLDWQKECLSLSNLIFMVLISFPTHAIFKNNCDGEEMIAHLWADFVFVKRVLRRMHSALLQIILSSITKDSLILPLIYELFSGTYWDSHQVLLEDHQLNVLSKTIWSLSTIK